MTVPENNLERAIGALLAATNSAPERLTEHRAARAEFATDPTSELGGRRTDEWYVLERHHQVLGGVPVELAIHGELETGDVDEETLAALVGSITGVFEVTGVQTGAGVWVRDLLAFGEYPLNEPEGSHSLTKGDLLVGRLFPVGDGLYVASRAAGVFRNATLKDALERDLERARSERRGVVRLSSLDLERMFWGPSPADEERRCAAEARAVLVRGGLGGEAVEAVFTTLRAAPFDGRILPGGSDALGEILAELAFATEVDLAAARAALLAYWLQLHAVREPASRADLANPVDQANPVDRAARKPASAGPDPRAAMAAFDRGRREGRDLEELFAELERDLELESEEEAAGEEAVAPDFPGVVGALVEEYLWELGREKGEAAVAAHAALRKLSVFGEPIGLFEELGGRELLSFASLWLPEWGELEGAEDARALLSALRSFCDWIQEGHEIPLRAAYDEFVAPLESSLPRVIEANRARTPGGRPTDGDWFIVTEVEPAALEVQSGSGALTTHAVAADLAAHLCSGDLVRARISGGELSVFCAYPAEARELTRPTG